MFFRSAVLLGCAAIAAFANPTFNFRPGTGVTVGDQVYNGFVAAAALWTPLFTDNVTINVDIESTPLGPNILGSTDNAFYHGSYSLITTALGADALSADDITAVTHLQPGASETFVQNHTAECGNCTTPYLDNNGNVNNSNLFLTGAEARALGLLPANNTSDGTITFSSDFAFDYDRTDGIDPAKYDFIGVAAHEIGHLLGFVSEVDEYDYCGLPTNCAQPYSETNKAPTVLDLFRFGTTADFGTRMDQSADVRPKYFSIDGGATLGPMFSTGVNFGDQHQASHWKDNMGLGIMDPSAAPGELLQISQNDIRALDVIGWNVAAPEPATWGLFAAGALLMFPRLRRRG